MITKLGIISGEILTLLSEVKSSLCLAEIEDYIDEPADSILMSLGWLLREGLINSECINGDRFFMRCPGERYGNEVNSLREEHEKIRK